jgi:hypothetical protein
LWFAGSLEEVQHAAISFSITSLILAVFCARMIMACDNFGAMGGAQAAIGASFRGLWSSGRRQMVSEK